MLLFIRKRKADTLLFRKALEKDTDIVYQIEASQSLLHKINSVEWTVSNSGIEASKEEELDYVVPKEAFTDEDNAVFRCKRHTAFNGLHYMICKIKAEGNITKINILVYMLMIMIYLRVT